MYCIDCGFDMKEEGKRFCTRCGSALLADDGPNAGETAGDDPAPHTDQPSEMRIHGGSAGLLSRIPKQSPVADPDLPGTGRLRFEGIHPKQDMPNQATPNQAVPNQATLRQAPYQAAHSQTAQSHTAPNQAAPHQAAPGRAASDLTPPNDARHGAAPLAGAIKGFLGGSRLRIAATAVAVVAVVTVGVLVVQRIGGANGKAGADAAAAGKETQATAKTGGLFAEKGTERGTSAYKAVLSGNVNDTDARLFAHGDRLYSFQPAGAFIWRIDAKTGESAKVDEVQRQIMEPSLAGDSIFFRNSDEAVEADGASTNLYRFDMDKETVEPVKGIEGACDMLSSDGHAAYAMMLVKGVGRKVIRVDAKTLAITEYPLQDEWKKDYADGFLVYGDKFYYHSYNDGLKSDDPHQSGIRSLDLKTGALAYEDLFGRINSLCVSDEGFAFVRGGEGWFLPHGAVEAKSLVKAENLYKAYQADGYVWYSVNEGETCTLFRVRPDGTDLRRIELPAMKGQPFDMAGDWLTGPDQEFPCMAYRFDKDGAVLAVHNVLRALREEPVTETVDVPFTAVEGAP